MHAADISRLKYLKIIQRKELMKLLENQFKSQALYLRIKAHLMLILQVW